MSMWVLLVGCGWFAERARVREVATEACRWGIDTALPPPSMWPAEVDMSAFIDPDDVLFARQQQELQAQDAGLFAALENAMVGAMAGPAKRMATVLHDTTTCTVDELVIDGGTGHVQLTKTSLELEEEDAFKLLAALASASDEEIRRVLEGNSSPEQTAVRYGLQRGPDGVLRIDLGSRDAAVDQARRKIEQADAELLAADEAKARLTTFLRVDRAALRRTRGWIPSTVFDIEVTNTGAVAIAEVEFDAVYSSPGRSVAWQKGALGYAIPGGLEPGESARWSLEPNLLNPFHRTELVAGAELVLSVSALTGADGTPIVDVPDAAQAAADKGRAETVLARLLALPAAG